jgi:hypothetical protein
LSFFHIQLFTSQTKTRRIDSSNKNIMMQQPPQRQPLTLLEIAQAWRRGDRYARLWLMLYYAGGVAPSALEARAKMRAEIENTAADGGVGAR